MPPTTRRPAPHPTVYALLKASSIGLVAPVVDGVGDSQLSVAVGHVPASSWPGTEGTSVLAGHDVTWFSHIDQLVPGEQISVVTPCQTFLYTVEDHQVVSSDTPIFQTEQSRLVLITCYPTDALFLTSQRYLVDAYLTAVVDVPVKTATPPSVVAPSVPTTPAVPAPPASRSKVSISPTIRRRWDHSRSPGAPSTTWQESSAPLNDTAAVVALYFAAIRSAEQGEGDWWVAIAPTVAYSSASHLFGATIIRNDSLLSPSLSVTGGTLTGVSLITEPVLSGNGYLRHLSHRDDGRRGERPVDHHQLVDAADRRMSARRSALTLTVGTAVPPRCKPSPHQCHWSTLASRSCRSASTRCQAGT